MATSQRKRSTLVYVEIPPSPYNLSKYFPMSSSKSSRVERATKKENMYLPLHSGDSPTAGASRKRKASDDGIHNRKSAKLKQDTVNLVDMTSLDGAESNDLPNGYFYCHQCSQRRDATAIIQCKNMTPPTSRKPNTGTQRCSAKYCKPCLKNRYGEDINEIKSGASSSIKAPDHVKSLGYTFKCPKCRNICNCSRCRRLQGLEPTGKLTISARKDGSASTGQVLHNNSKFGAATLAKGYAKRGLKMNGNATPSLLQRKKASNPSSEPILLAPKWTRLYTSLELPAAEDRIYIREFMLRFGKIMNPPISKSHLGELGLIESCFKGHEDMAPWVSESCVRSMILGLFSLLAPQSRNEEAIKSAMKEIRSIGPNLTKVWSTLQQLRETFQPSSSAGRGGTYTEFPDPLPPPPSSVVRQTRSMQNAENTQRSVCIHCSGQMVPVLVALIDIATVTMAVREEIEEGLKDARELARTSKETIRLVNENREKICGRLEDKAVDKAKKKALRNTYKRRLLSIEKASDIITSNRAARFAGLLGRDDGGRLYWTVSPGIEEVIAAHQFITDVSNEEMPEAVASTNSRSNLTQGNDKGWSWFLAVWGHPPTDTEYSDDEEDGGDQEKWWVFDKAEEIRKLALQLGHTNGAGSPKADIQILSKRIMDFADLLEWRNRADRYD